LLFRPLIDPFVRKNKETLFIQRTVDEFLFKGYPQHTVKDISEKLLDGKVLLPNNIFGLYHGVSHGTFWNWEFSILPTSTPLEY